MEQTVKERLIQFLRYNSLSQRQFEKQVGLGNGYVTNMRGTIGGDKLYRISVEYPQLNVEWLLTGEGEMLISENPMKQQPGRHGSDISYLLRLIEEHDIRFHELANRILDGMGVASTQKEKIA